MSEIEKAKTENAPAPPVPPPSDPNSDLDTNIVVVAHNTQEMVTAQSRLIAWAGRKVAAEMVDRDELKENLEAAVRNGWSTKTLKRHVNKAQKRVEFYEKVKAALEAGYTIVPNFDIDIFAIRTAREEPLRATFEQWQLPPYAPESPPLGEGDFVSEKTSNSSHTVNEGSTEKPRHVTYLTREQFQEVDFPFALAKQEVLNSTAKALAGRFFDALGITPARRQAARRGDPMVIGRIVMKDGHTERSVSFLVTWFLDTADL